MCFLIIMIHVTTRGLNVIVIRACIRGQGELPEDDEAMKLAKSGELRHFADVLGGFHCVDIKALKAYAMQS